MAAQRLDKIIASTGRWSRREVKDLIRQGRVTVDGVPARSAEEKADPEQAVIAVNGELLNWRRYTWVMLNKPAGYLSATEDGRGATVLDLLPQDLQRQGLFPVGRLDKDTEGLLLLTNEGGLAHELLSPKKHVDKEYYVRGTFTKYNLDFADDVMHLNELGFDVGELSMKTTADGLTTTVAIQPKVVDAGHYHRQVMRLTGLDVQERQGQRMLNDLEAYRAITGRSEDPIELVAHSWLAEVFEPTIHSVPVEMRRKLEPAEIFHEILEHRWYMSEAQDRYVTTQEAVEDYVATVLPQHRDERAYLGGGDTQEMEAIVVDDADEPMPEDDAEFAARDEQTLADYAANPYGFTAGMKFKGE